MNSYLIISSSNDKALEKAHTLLAEKKVDLLDILIFDLTTTESKTGMKKSWGIDDMKAFQKKVFLKPIRGEWKGLILKDAHLLTTEAQNALLKLLEEPPITTSIILISSSLNALLPTIISRCFLIHLDTPSSESTIDTAKIQEEFLFLSSSNIGEKLKKAESLAKNKEESLLWIKNTIFSLHEELHHNPKNVLIDNLRLLQSTHRTITTTNTNLRLTLEHLFLSLRS